MGGRDMLLATPTGDDVLVAANSIDDMRYAGFDDIMGAASSGRPMKSFVVSEPYRAKQVATMDTPSSGRGAHPDYTEADIGGAPGVGALECEKMATSQVGGDPEFFSKGGAVDTAEFEQYGTLTETMASTAEGERLQAGSFSLLRAPLTKWARYAQFDKDKGPPSVPVSVGCLTASERHRRFLSVEEVPPLNPP